MLQQWFSAHIPYNRYKLLFKPAQGVNIIDVARRLWQGARLILKRVNDDRRIRFGVWSNKAISQDTIEMLRAQAKSTMPAGSSVNTARCYAALFGEIADLETWPGRMQIGYTIFLCTYTNTESALICHGM